MSKSRKGSKRLVTRRFKTRRHKTRRPKTRRPKTRRPKARRTTSRRNRTRTYKTRERKKNREKEPEILTMVRNRLKHMKKVLKKQRGGGTTAENIMSAMSNLVDLLYQSPVAPPPPGAEKMPTLEKFTLKKLGEFVTSACSVYAILHWCFLKLNDQINKGQWNNNRKTFNDLIDGDQKLKKKLLGDMDYLDTHGQRNAYTFNTGRTRGVIGGFYEDELLAGLREINKLSIGVPIHLANTGITTMGESSSTRLGTRKGDNWICAINGLDPIRSDLLDKDVNYPTIEAQQSVAVGGGSLQVGGALEDVVVTIPNFGNPGEWVKGQITNGDLFWWKIPKRSVVEVGGKYLVRAKNQIMVVPILVNKGQQVEDQIRFVKIPNTDDRIWFKVPNIDENMEVESGIEYINIAVVNQFSSKEEAEANVPYGIVNAEKADDVQNSEDLPSSDHVTVPEPEPEYSLALEPEPEPEPETATSTAAGIAASTAASIKMFKGGYLDIKYDDRELVATGDNVPMKKVYYKDGVGADVLRDPRSQVAPAPAPAPAPSPAGAPVPDLSREGVSEWWRYHYKFRKEIYVQLLKSDTTVTSEGLSKLPSDLLDLVQVDANVFNARGDASQQASMDTLCKESTNVVKISVINDGQTYYSKHTGPPPAEGSRAVPPYNPIDDTAVDACLASAGVNSLVDYTAQYIKADMAEDSDWTEGFQDVPKAGIKHTEVLPNTIAAHRRPNRIAALDSDAVSAHQNFSFLSDATARDYKALKYYINCIIYYRVAVALLFNIMVDFLNTFRVAYGSRMVRQAPAPQVLDNEHENGREWPTRLPSLKTLPTK